ncbi:MAG: histidine kinase [Bacteroidetes bacterium]|nr:histidine kinase [Bacteroidota bacterium]
MKAITGISKTQKWLALPAWLFLYIFWVLVFQKRAFAFSRTATVEFCYLLFIAANYYFNSLLLIPRFLYPKRYFLFGLLFIAGVVITALLRVPLAMYLNEHYFMPGEDQPGFQKIFMNSLLNIFIWVVGIVAAKLVIDRFRFQRYVDEITMQKNKAELDFLNAQLNPHFLFNSINSIYGHIDKKNTGARNMLLTFSEMLRYQLYECNTDMVDVDKEMKYISNYVSLQQSRKEDSLMVKLQVADNVGGFSIAPLLFIAFIENAFKYVGNSCDKDNSVSITFGKKENMLWFSCVNTIGAGVNNSITHSGIGIANTKKRLALLYPGTHELCIREDEELYVVQLTLQLNP